MKPSERSDEREEPEHPDFFAETYESVNKMTGKATLVLYDPEDPIAWVESDLYCDLEDVA